MAKYHPISFQNFLGMIFMDMRAILFGDDGCKSCRMWRPVLQRLCSEKGIDLIEIEVYKPENKEMKEKYDIKGVPFTLFLDGDNEVCHILGNMDEGFARRHLEHYGL